MASLAPPDNVLMLTGTWGTDADKSSTALYGASSIQLKNTSVATKIAMGYIPITSGQASSKEYEAVVIYQADSNSGANTATFKVKTYNASFTLVSTNVIMNALPVAAANTWYTRSLNFPVTSSTERFARIEIEKSATAYNVYVNEASIQPIGPRFAAVATTNAAIPTGTWTAITAYNVTVGYEAVIASGVVNFVRSKVGHLRARVKWASSIPDGTAIGIRLTSSLGVLDRTYFKVGGADNHEIEVSWTGLIDSWAGASNTQVTYYVEVYQDSGSNKDALVRFQGFQAGF